jgi:hypothetical protein
MLRALKSNIDGGKSEVEITPQATSCLLRAAMFHVKHSPASLAQVPGSKIQNTEGLARPSLVVLWILDLGPWILD